MSENVIFVRPVEKVGVIYDILKSCSHTNFPVVDTEDKGVLYGTIGRNALCFLLKNRAFGQPRKQFIDGTFALSMSSDYLEVDPDNKRFLPTLQWEEIEKSYPKYPSVKDLRISRSDRECYVDMRPFANTSPLTIHEGSSASVSEVHVHIIHGQITYQ